MLITVRVVAGEVAPRDERNAIAVAAHRGTDRGAVVAGRAAARRQLCDRVRRNVVREHLPVSARVRAGGIAGAREHDRTAVTADRGTAADQPCAAQSLTAATPPSSTGRPAARRWWRRARRSGSRTGTRWPGPWRRSTVRHAVVRARDALADGMGVRNHMGLECSGAADEDRTPVVEEGGERGEPAVSLMLHFDVSVGFTPTRPHVGTLKPKLLSTCLTMPVVAAPAGIATTRPSSTRTRAASLRPRRAACAATSAQPLSVHVAPHCQA